MKKIIYTILLVFILLLSPTVYGDFFQDNIIGNDIEFEKLDNFTLKPVTFKNSLYSKKYIQSKYFLDQFKDEIKFRYVNEFLSYYDLCDVINDLDYLVYSLNKYYSNLKKYEDTKSKIYYDLSWEHFSNVRLFYNKLKYTLNKK
ncbi:hypothetical protein KAZ01_00915 [Candidatus Gracilibacteria bacterium]|nr:hypothetical protein [Candidatus Gracilibacteria bacterium]